MTHSFGVNVLFIDEEEGEGEDLFSPSMDIIGRQVPNKYLPDFSSGQSIFMKTDLAKLGQIQFGKVCTYFQNLSYDTQSDFISMF